MGGEGRDGKRQGEGEGRGGLAPKTYLK